MPENNFANGQITRFLKNAFSLRFLKMLNTPRNFMKFQIGFLDEGRTAFNNGLPDMLSCS